MEENKNDLRNQINILNEIPKNDNVTSRQFINAIPQCPNSLKVIIRFYR